MKLPYLFIKAFNILRTDKKLILISMIPLIIGFVAYYFLGNYIFTDLKQMGMEYLKTKIEINSYVGAFLTGLIAILYAFFISFTFFIFISLIASPFNDVISSMVEKKYNPNVVEETLATSLKRFPKIMVNEFKKVAFIIILSVLNLVLSFVFAPLSIFLGGVILSVSFVDYSWSRNYLTFGECLKNYKNGFLVYVLGGIGFMFLVAIPIMNIFFLPFAVVFFTVLFCETKYGNS